MRQIGRSKKRDRQEADEQCSKNREDTKIRVL